MPNIASAEKNVRKTKARTLRNSMVTSRVRTFRKRVMDAAGKGDAAAIKKAFSEFSSVTDKAAKVGVIHKNTAIRLKSRVSAHLRKLATAAVTK